MCKLLTVCVLIRRRLFTIKFLPIFETEQMVWFLLMSGYLSCLERDLDLGFRVEKPSADLRKKNLCTYEMLIYIAESSQKLYISKLLIQISHKIKLVKYEVVFVNNDLLPATASKT